MLEFVTSIAPTTITALPRAWALIGGIIVELAIVVNRYQKSLMLVLL